MICYDCDKDQPDESFVSLESIGHICLPCRISREIEDKEEMKGGGKNGNKENTNIFLG